MSNQNMFGSFEEQIDELRPVLLQVYNVMERTGVKSADSVHKFVSRIIKGHEIIEETRELTLSDHLICFTVIRSLLQQGQNYVLKNVDENCLIQIDFAGEPLCLSFMEWNSFLLEPTLRKITRRINEIERLCSDGEAIMICEIKRMINDYFITNITTSDLKTTLQTMRIPDSNKKCLEIRSIVVKLCDNIEHIGSEAFELALCNLLVN